MNKDQAKKTIESESLLRQEAKQNINKREVLVLSQKYGEDVVRNKNEPEETHTPLISDDEDIVHSVDSLQSELYVESKFQSKKRERIVEEPKGKAEGSSFYSTDSHRGNKYNDNKTDKKVSKTKFTNTKPGKNLNENEDVKVGKVKAGSSSKYDIINKAKDDKSDNKLFKVSEDKLSDAIAKKRRTETKLTETELRQKAYFTNKLENAEPSKEANKISDDDVIVNKTFKRVRAGQIYSKPKLKRGVNSLSSVKYHVSDAETRLGLSNSEDIDYAYAIQNELGDIARTSTKFVSQNSQRMFSELGKTVERRKDKSRPKTNAKFVVNAGSMNRTKEVATEADLVFQKKRRFFIFKKKEEQIFADMTQSMARKIVSKIKQIATRNKIGVIIAAVCIAFALSAIGSVGVIFEGLSQATGTYLSGLSLSTDFDMTDCENYYKKLEADLQEVLDNLEEYYPGYDRYDLEFDDEIGHDALKLMAYLSAVYEGYDLSLIQDVLDTLFDDMYVVETEELTEYEDDVELLVFSIKITKTKWDDLMASRISDEKNDLYDSYEKNGGGHQAFHNPFAINWKDKVTSEFGWRIHPITGEEKFHSGVDIAMPKGTPVMSCSEGVVVKCASTDVEGNYVVVEDVTGYRCSYMHLSEICVSVGDKVDYDTLIGKVGSTGRSTGPHLHLQVTDNKGELLNPKFMVQGGY